MPQWHPQSLLVVVYFQCFEIKRPLQSSLMNWHRGSRIGRVVTREFLNWRIPASGMLVNKRFSNLWVFMIG